MTEVLVATGTSVDDLHPVGTVDDLPPGTPFTIFIQLEWWAPVGGFADLFLAEWVARQMYDVGESTITDVEGGWHWVKIHCVAVGVPVPFIIAAIVAIIIAIGIAVMIARIDITAVLETVAQGINTALLVGAVALGVVGVAYVATRKTNVATT